MTIDNTSWICQRAFMTQAVALWTAGTEKPEKDLADAVGVHPGTLSHWKGGRVPLNLDNAARIIYQLHLADCFDGDATQALDLAWLMGLNAGAVKEELDAVLETSAGLKDFSSWLEKADRDQAHVEIAPYLPRLPAYHIPTRLAEQVKQALIAPRAYRSPQHQVVILHGGPAAGKTTSVAAVLRDQALQHYFRDGTLFVPLADAEDRGQALRRACEQARLAIDLVDGSETLQRVFRDWANDDGRLALLVLDDPQSDADLTPFLDVGPQVRILITCQDRRLVARALEEHWEPASDLLLWQAVRGLAAQEGLALVTRWQPGELSAEEEQARQHVGELLGWHPLALRLCAAEARDTSWCAVEELVIEGNLDPNDFDELAGWFRRSWDRLPPADRQALTDLQRAFHPASTFGPGVAAAVWEQSNANTQVRLTRLEDRALIEQVSGEPRPWQGWIEQSFGGQERYRLMPLLRLIDLQPERQEKGESRFELKNVRWLQGVERRAKISFGPRQVPLRFVLANLIIGLPAWLLNKDTDKLEERLLDFWNRQGIAPPAEVWLAFQKTRWLYLPMRWFGVLMFALTGAQFAFLAPQPGEAFWMNVVTAALAWLVTALIFYMSVYQRMWWLWLLTLHGQETTELKWTWRVARLFGLRKPSA
jgi:hypothetical protein